MNKTSKLSQTLLTITVVTCLIASNAASFAQVTAATTTLTSIPTTTEKTGTAESPVSESYSDMSKHWSKTYVKSLVDKKVTNGYPDGTFKPDGTITIAEFTKILVSSLGHTNLGNGSKHWADKYMDKAWRSGLIFSNEPEFTKLDTNITRAQMSRMISRAMTEKYPDMYEFAYQIKDYWSIEVNDQNPILLMFRTGVITGYPDGNFKPSANATRGEACTMLMRYLDKNLRTEPKPQYASGLRIEESDEMGVTDFYICVDMRKTIPLQIIDLRAFLTPKIGSISTEKIISHVLKKTHYKQELEPFSLAWNKSGNVYCASNAGNGLIIVRGDDGIND